jgi:hypothetical protein
MGMARQAMADIVSVLRWMNLNVPTGFDPKQRADQEEWLASLENNTRDLKEQNRKSAVSAFDALTGGPGVQQEGKDALTGVIDRLRDLKGPVGLKLDMPKPNFAPPPDIPIPEAYNPDFSNLAGAVGGGKSSKAQNAVRAGSSQHAVQAYEHMRNLSAVQASGKTSSQDLQKQQLNVQVDIRNGINQINRNMGGQQGGAQPAQLDSALKGFVR